jgi:uncharacterized protein with HEPN domain
MFKRDIRLYLEDILESIQAIEDYTDQIDFDFFSGDRKTYAATLREFIVIGEAINHLPDEMKIENKTVQWRLIKDFRNFIVHEYFGIDPKIVWDAVQQELTPLKTEISRLLQAADVRR